MALVISLPIAAVSHALAEEGSEQPVLTQGAQSKVFIDQLHVVGKGSLTDTSGEATGWIKIAVGSVWLDKEVIHRVGVAFVYTNEHPFPDGVKYKIQDIAISEEGVITANLFTEGTQKGTITLQHAMVGGVEIVKGDLVIEGKTHKILLLSHWRKYKDSEKPKIVERARELEECESTDSDDECKTKHDIINARVDIRARAELNDDAEKSPQKINSALAEMSGRQKVHAITELRERAIQKIDIRVREEAKAEVESSGKNTDLLDKLETAEDLSATGEIIAKPIAVQTGLSGKAKGETGL